jgi:glycosyltransferase involved in cell wall biosynthesis
MRIALVSREYPPESAKGGLGTQTYQKAHELARLGNQVHVISEATETGPREYRDGEVQVVRVEHSSWLSPSSEVADWILRGTAAAAAIQRLHVQHPVDLVDVPEWGGEGYIHLLNRTDWNSIPTVVQIHGSLAMFHALEDWPEAGSELYQTGTHMEATCFRLADGVYSSSRYSTEWCARAYGIDSLNTPTLHAGVDTDLFHPFDLPGPECPTIVFAGRISRSKGIMALVKAACRLSSSIPGLRLRLLGAAEPELIREIEAETQFYHAQDLIEIAGFVNRNELPAQLSRAHVFAAPSTCEGGPGLVYLEAMACGLPVVACEETGVAEIVTHGENGFLVPRHDVEALTVAIRRLLCEPELRAKLGSAARRFAVQNNSAACVARIAAFYESVLQRTQAPRSVVA